VQIRILAGLGAWLLGATAATAGSLLAVSLLGQGIAASPGQQLTTSAVNRALAHEADEATAGSPAPARSAARPAATLATATPVPAAQPQQIEASPSARAAASQAVTAPPPTPSPTAGGTVLTSPGGTALAECGTAGSYLVAWSPTQGYETGDVARGPAATTRVTFESDANSVTMVVTCSSGTPTATSSVHDSGGDGE
jgi:hypothetical protein